MIDELIVFFDHAMHDEIGDSFTGHDEKNKFYTKCAISKKRFC